MALNTINEDEKKKRFLSPTTDDAFTGEVWNVPAPIKKKQASMDYPGDPNSESFYGGSNPQRALEKLTGSTPLSEPKISKLYDAPASLNLPKINEIPNAQRDSELGKMNVSTDGNTTTYNIGRDTLSYKLSDRDKQLKTNLERIDQMVASGVEVSPEQMTRINNLRRQAGFLRGGTDRQLSNPTQQSNLDVEFDSTVIPEARETFLKNPVAPVAQMDRYDKRQLAQPVQENPDPKPVMPTNRTNQAMANYNQAMGEWSGRQLTREGQSLTKDANRIDELGVTAENKLRDIQGQVMQNPPDKENPLKPIVVKEYDELGNVIGEKIKLPGPDGTYGTANQAQGIQLSDNHPAIEFLRKNPATANKFKERYGYLPSWAVTK